jgi:hypothetical protein
MRARTLLTTAAAAAIGLSFVAPAGASGDGGIPYGADAGPSGVTAPDALGRYVALQVGRRTVLERIQPHTGRVAAWRTLRGRFAVPAVALDGTPGGLSADGRTLVLVRPQRRFPIARTHMQLIDPMTLRSRTLRLRGNFTFDALAPDGKTLYVTEYVSAKDPTRYAVRAYDVAARRLLPGAIVDRREPEEEMAGSPLTRVSSPDARWAYTLYDGNGRTPFVHALDTTGRRAFCIDLPALRGIQDLYDARLVLRGPGVEVVSRGETVAGVDTRTMRASTAPAPAPPAAPAACGVRSPVRRAAPIPSPSRGRVAPARRRLSPRAE